MATVDEVHGYIRQFISGVGIDPNTTFNDQSKAYYLTKGSANIEVFVSAHPQPNGSTRNFLRVFSPIMDVPNESREYFYRRLLELNDASLGVKFSIMPGSQKVYATFERDIEGIDAAETATCISDLGLWSDYLDDVLKNEFPSPAGGGGAAPKG